MKPDWKDAPVQANFIAQDGDGSWWWFADKPIWDEECQRWDTEGEIWEALDLVPAEETLEPRP